MTAPVWVEIDADGHGALISGGGRWSFDLDLATDTALLRLGETGMELVRVRALRWQEKLALARFASLGPAFVTHAFATTCASVRLTAGPDDAAVAALARWLEDPGKPDIEPDVGLDPQRLASMTVELCRLTGLRPADLDGLPAAEVAQLWAGLQAGSGDAAPAWSDPRGADDTMNRIVVIDDETTASSGVAHVRQQGGSVGEDGGAMAEAADGPSMAASPDEAEDAPLAAGSRMRRGPADRSDAARPGSRKALTRGPATTGRRPAITLRRAFSDPPTLVGLDRLAGPAPAASGGPRAVGRARGAASNGASAHDEPLVGDARSRGLEPTSPRHIGLLETTSAGHGAGFGRSPSSRSISTELGRGRPGGSRTAAPARGASRGDRRWRPDTAALAAGYAEGPGQLPRWDGPAFVAPRPRVLGSLAAATADVTSWAEAAREPATDREAPPAPLDRSQREALFQALAEDLELATTELGIGSEA